MSTPKKCHLLIPDLLLPPDIVADASAGLDMPSLERMLARAQQQPLVSPTMESWLCDIFGVEGQAIAPVTLRRDGIQPEADYWLRADPVHIQMRRDQFILQPEVHLNVNEAAQMCAELNRHFAGEGLHFIAPHPQRWYVRLNTSPDLFTYPLAQVASRNLRSFMPQGEDALRWHKLFNEIQMLFHEHPVNEARAARGEQPINSVWIWGGGKAVEKLKQPFAKIAGDSWLVEAFAQAAEIPWVPLSTQDADSYFTDVIDADNVLIVWEGLRRALQMGDLQAWRNSLQHLEKICLRPLWQAVRNGRIAQLTLDTMHADVAVRHVLKRGGAWRLWRRPTSLINHTVV